MVQGVVLDGKQGLSTSLEPTLKWPDAPSGQKQFEVLDLAGRSIWRADVAADNTRVDPGVLKQGGAYRWRATGSGKSFDGGLVRVDMQRLQVQGAPSFGGVSVGAVSGEALFSWSSQPLGSVSGGVGLTLSFQPSNTQLQAPSPGLPSGWLLTGAGGSQWPRLKVISADWVELISSTGAAVPFARGSGGLWVAQLGTDQRWPVGSEVSLSLAKDGTWSATDRNGVVTLFPASKTGATVWARAVWRDGEPSVQQVYGSTGRLKALKDPVSGRSIRFIYRGVNETSDLKCVEPKAAHMKIAPSGYLCLTSGWEEPYGRNAGAGKPQRNRFFYAEDGSRTVLARIVGDSQAGGQLASVTDLAYDSRGRLKAMRSPLATRAVAAGVLKARPAADDQRVLTTIDYDSQGRVARVTRPAALSTSRTGERAWRSFAWSAQGDSVTQVVKGSDTSQTLARVTSTVADMLTTRSEDNAGRVTTTEWDRALDAPLKISSPGGLVQTFSYDALGNPVEQRGPSTQVDSSAAPVSRTSFDTELNGTDTRPQRGLQALYYKGRDFQGAPVSHQTGPRIGGSEAVASLSFSWPSSPINSTTKDWSARLFGYVRVPQDGDFSFTAGPGTSLWISGQLCSPTCERKGLKADQLLSIQLQAISAVNGTGSIDATWSGPGASGAIPSTNLRPGYTSASAEAVDDALSSGTGLQELKTSLTYSPSDPARLIAARSPSGKVSARSYEPYDPQSGRFGRSTAYEGTGGQQSTTTYYGQHDQVSAPSECPQVGGRSFDQGGMPRSMGVASDFGVSKVQDNAGRPVVTRTNNQLTSCQAYDEAGNPTVAHYPASGDAPAATSTTTYNATGNPLRTVQETRQGSTVRSAAARIDILGRQISSTDVWKTTTIVEYDSFDRPVKTTARTGTGQKTVTLRAYDDAGNLKSITVDGKQLGSFTYDDAGRMTRATYGNGSSATFEYNQNGALSARTLNIGGKETKESVETAPGGRILGRSFSGPSADGSWKYAYDRDGRLTSAELSGTVPEGAQTGTWTYEVNDASQRTAITRPGTGPGQGRVTFSYGDAGEIEGTSDSRFGAQGEDQFRYDALDRATHAGSLEFAYDSSGSVRQVKDSKTTVDYQLSAGAVIGQTITTADPQGGKPASKSVRFSSGGLILCPRCETGTAISRIVELPGGVSVELPIAAARSAQSPAADTWRYQDLQGNNAWQSVGSQAPDTTIIYDPDGNQLTTQPAPSFDPASPNLRFRSLAATPTEIPVLAMGQRSYIPALGIFMQPDPIVNAGPTPYNYGFGDPINYADESGQAGWCWATFTKVAIGVVVGVAVGALTAGTGSVLAAAALSAVVDASSQVLAQSVIMLAEIPDAEGNVQTELNTTEIIVAGVSGAVFGGALASIGSKAASPATSRALSQADEAVDGGGGGMLSLLTGINPGKQALSKSVVNQVDDPLKSLVGNLQRDTAEYQAQESSRFLSKISDEAVSRFNKNSDPVQVTGHLFQDPNQLPDFFFLPPGVKSAIK